MKTLKQGLLLLALYSNNIIIPVSSARNITCGCPETCTNEALQERNGSPWTCLERIEFLMKRYEDPEANACAGASKDLSLDEEDNHIRPCRPEACNPKVCPSSTLVVDPFPHRPIDCGCPQSCTPDALNTIMGPIGLETNYSCYDRIHYIKRRWHVTEWEACATAVKEGSCINEACHPETCGSFLPSPPPPPVSTHLPPPVEKLEDHSSGDHNNSISGFSVFTLPKKSSLYLWTAAIVFIAVIAIASQSMVVRQCRPVKRISTLIRQKYRHAIFQCDNDDSTELQYKDDMMRNINKHNEDRLHDGMLNNDVVDNNGLYHEELVTIVWIKK